MDIRLLIEESFHKGLTLINSIFYHITEEKNEVWFHDENAYDLFLDPPPLWRKSAAKPFAAERTCAALKGIDCSWKMVKLKKI